MYEDDFEEESQPAGEMDVGQGPAGGAFRTIPKSAMSSTTPAAAPSVLCCGVVVGGAGEVLYGLELCLVTFCWFQMVRV